MKNAANAAFYIRKMLEALEITPELDPEVEETPDRFAALLLHLFRESNSPEPTLSTFTFASSSSSAPILTVTDISFSALCVHHLVPFFGTVDLALIPNKLYAGFGSFGRVVDWAAAKPQVQERMTDAITTIIDKQLQPKGLLVRCRARQMCVEMRGSRHQSTYEVLLARGILDVNGDLQLRSNAILQLNQNCKN